MRGDLSETSAADVCRALATSEADGVLEIEGPDGRGSLVWRAGAIIGATSPTPRARLGDRLVGAGLLSEDELDEVLHVQARDGDGRRLGAILVDSELVSRDAVRLVAQEQVIDAVFDVVRWRYGAYRLDPLDGELAPEVPLRLPVEHLLAEVDRRRREWDELQRVIPDLAAVPSFRTEVQADTSLEPDEFAVLASVDGHRSVRELADALGYGEFEAARILYGLWMLGIVEIAPPEDEIGRALEAALHDIGEDDPYQRVRDAPPPTGTPAAEIDPPLEAAADATDAEDEPDGVADVAPDDDADEPDGVADVAPDDDADAADDAAREPAAVTVDGEDEDDAIAVDTEDDADAVDGTDALDDADAVLDPPDLAVDSDPDEPTGADPGEQAVAADGPVPALDEADAPVPALDEADDPTPALDEAPAAAPDGADEPAAWTSGVIEPAAPATTGWVDPPPTPQPPAAPVPPASPPEAFPPAAATSPEDRTAGARSAEADEVDLDALLAAFDAEPPPSLSPEETADTDELAAEVEPEPEPEPEPRDAGDVAELLRELSRLALSEPEEDPSKPSAPPPPRPPTRPADAQRKRRGLFGRS